MPREIALDAGFGGTSLHDRGDGCGGSDPRFEDAAAQSFALSLGAAWAGDSDVLPPKQLDAAIIFAPVGSPVPAALKAVRKGGRVVYGGIHM